MKGIFRHAKENTEDLLAAEIKSYVGCTTLWNVSLAFGFTVTLVLTLGLKGRKCPSYERRKPHDRLDASLCPFCCSGEFWWVFLCGGGGLVVATVCVPDFCCCFIFIFFSSYFNYDKC